MADGMLSLSWNNHKATFCHILSTLRDKERYTDVTVACEGMFYPVHKLVLSTCSEYFEKIFENTPCKHPVIVLKDVNRSDLEALFCYMYEGAVSVAQSNLGRLIKAAEVLRIKGLAVPDEPPISEGGNKRGGLSHTSDDRSSPHPKRRRREESGYNTRGSVRASPSPPVSPRTSPSRSESDLQHLRSKPDNVWANQKHSEEHSLDHQLDDRPVDHVARSSPTPPQVEVMVDESLVKEEMVDQGDDVGDDVVETGMEYGSVGSDSRLDGSGVGVGEEDPGGHMIPNKFEQKMNPTSQAQPLPEAVVEALAGPSGMQGWLGGCEMPGGFSGLEGYGEGSQDMHQVAPGSQSQAHQMVGLGRHNTRMTEPRRAAPGVVGVIDPTMRLKDTCAAPPCSHYGKKPDPSCPHCLVYQSRRVSRGPAAGYGKNSSSIKVHQCRYCAYTTNFTTNLINHMRTHTGEKPFQCPHCPYRANQRTNLTMHMRTHTGEKPYACSMCPYRSSRKDALRSHLSKHTGTDRNESQDLTLS